MESYLCEAFCYPRINYNERYIQLLEELWRAYNSNSFLKEMVCRKQNRLLLLNAIIIDTILIICNL